MMIEPSGLPSDWRQRDDWVELLLHELLHPTTEEHTLALIEIGEELAHAGAFRIAMTISGVIALSLVNEPVESIQLLEFDGASPDWQSLIDRVRGGGSQTAERAAVLRLAGNLVRGIVEEDDDRSVSVALSWYVTAADIYEFLNQTYEAAVVRQSESATRFFMGDVDGAENIALRILPTFRATGARFNEIGVRLNLVQYAIEREELSLAERRLKKIEPLLSARDAGHFRSSYLALSALVAVRRGRLNLAQNLFARSLKSAQRRQDVPQQIALLQDLAAVSNDLGDSAAAMRWLRRGVRTAEQSLNRRAEQAFLRSLGAALVAHERYEEALTAFLAAASINEDLRLPRAGAQSRADAAGVLTARAIRAFGRVSGDDNASKRRRYPTDREIGAAEDALLASFDELLALRDLAWLERVGRNLETLWLVNGRAEIAAEFFPSAAVRVGELDSEVAASFFEVSMRMGIAARRELLWLEQVCISGAKQEALSLPDEPTASASYLARLGTQAGNVSDQWELALALYSLALNQFQELNDSEGYAHVQNDAAVAADRLGDLEGARRRFEEVRHIAIASENRVLHALALTNLGELELKGGDPSVARGLLEEGARVSIEIGDYEQAAEAWASIAGSLISSPQDIDSARAANERAADLARVSGSRAAIARSTSNAASIAYLDDDMPGARRLWRQAQKTSDEKDMLYQSFILESWAREQNWRSFQRALEQYANQAQSANEGLPAGQKLGRPIATLLRIGQPRRAARVAAVALLLATDGLSRRRGRERSVEDLLREDRLWVDFLSIFGAIELIVMDAQLVDSDRSTFDQHLAAEFGRSAGATGISIFRRGFAIARESIEDNEQPGSQPKP